eukprot:2880851-Alexandrium_andersonii.AAC.1
MTGSMGKAPINNRVCNARRGGAALAFPPRGMPPCGLEGKAPQKARAPLAGMSAGAESSERATTARPWPHVSSTRTASDDERCWPLMPPTRQVWPGRRGPMTAVCWDPYVARAPTCYLHATHGPSVPSSASIRNPPFRKCEHRFRSSELEASRVRSLKCTNTETASTSLPEAPDGCVLRHFSRRLRIRRGTRGVRGSEAAKVAKHTSTAILNLRNPMLLARESPVLGLG